MTGPGAGRPPTDPSRGGEAGDAADHSGAGGPPRVSFRNAVGWSYVMNGGQYLITTIISLVLAAILGPTAFGTVAMATVYVLFVQMLFQQGMTPAIVQRRDLRPAHLDTGFWIVLAASLVLTGASIALAGVWAAVNRTPELAAVIRVLSLLLPIQGLIVVQDAILRRALRFRSLAVRSNVSALAGGAVGITLAFAGFGVWALVAQQLSRSMVQLVVLWTVSDWRPHLRFSRVAARELLGYAAGATTASLGVFVNNRSDALLIGLFFGPTAVGLYRFAARFVDLVIDVTVRALQSVSLPELARLQRDRGAFAERTVGIVRTSALLAVPLLGVLAGTSDALVGLVGPEWIAAADPLKLLCAVGAVRAVTLFTGPMLQALARTQLLTVVNWGSAGLSAGSFVAAGLLLSDASTAGQVLGMAASRLLLFGGAFLAINLYLAKRVLRLPLAAVTRPVLPAALAAVVAYGAARAIDWLVLDGVAEILRMMLVAGPSLVGCLAFLVIIDPALRRLVGRLVARARHRGAAGGGPVTGGHPGGATRARQDAGAESAAPSREAAP